jgi:hypothetical protein
VTLLNIVFKVIESEINMVMGKGDEMQPALSLS